MILRVYVGNFWRLGHIVVLSIHFLEDSGMLGMVQYAQYAKYHTPKQRDCHIPERAVMSCNAGYCNAVWSGQIGV
jgi:hypothetical protein